MRYVLVLQWPGSSEADLERLLRMENILEQQLEPNHPVDGHDFGSGEMNLFVETDSPRVAFSIAQSSLSDQPGWSEVRAAFREIGENNYVVLWPSGLDHFSVA